MRSTTKKTNKSLRQRAWAKAEDELLSFEEWIALANRYPDQDFVWHEYDRHVRTSNDGKPMYQDRMQVEVARPWDLSELGGEG